MGLFGKGTKSEEQKRAEMLPHHKKVEFQDMKLNEVESLLDMTAMGVLKLEPVNYSASKIKYLVCEFFYNDDYTEIYMQLKSFANDKETGTGKVRKVTVDLYKSVLGKFGLRLDVLKK